MSTQREITYSTGKTSNLTGASQKQIIYWEKKGFIPKVGRNICGDIAYRRFKPSQVELIQKIKRYLDQGYTMARAAELVRNGKRLDQ